MRFKIKGNLNLVRLIINWFILIFDIFKNYVDILFKL